MSERFWSRRDGRHAGKRRHGVRTIGRVLTAAGAIPLALVVGCSSASSVSSSDMTITNVPNSSQLPQASPATAVDYRAAYQIDVQADMESASGDGLSNVTAALGEIKNKRIRDFTTAAADNAIAGNVLYAASGQIPFGNLSAVKQTINGLQVVSVREAAREGLDDTLAELAIGAAGGLTPLAEGDNPPSEQDANNFLANITDPKIRNEAQNGVTSALNKNYTKAENIARFFEQSESQIEYTIYNAGTEEAQVLDEKAKAA